MAKESKYKLNSYDDLFGVGKNEEQPVKIAVTELHEFRNHPYYVIDDEDMHELVESIEKEGVLIPLIARPMKNGGYELISGHRRKHAAELAGLEKVPVSVRELSDKEAIDVMISTNIQRTNILPSEKAFAYRMQWEATYHRGKKGVSTPKKIGEQTGDSTRKVQRYIRLTYLISDLLTLVDERKLTMQAAYEISFLGDKEQGWIFDIYRETGKLPSGKTAETIRKEFDEKKLTNEKLRIIIMGELRKTNRKITLKNKRINEYFPPDYSEGQIEEIIYKLLDRWRDEQNE